MSSNLWLWPHVILPTPGARVIFVTADGEQRTGEYWGGHLGGFYARGLGGWWQYHATKWRRA